MMSPARSERVPLRPLLTHSELTHLQGPLPPAFPTACAALLPSLTLRARWIPAGGRGTLRVARTLRLIATISSRRDAERLVAHIGKLSRWLASRASD